MHSGREAVVVECLKEERSLSVYLLFESKSLTFCAHNVPAPPEEKADKETIYSNDKRFSSVDVVFVPRSGSCVDTIRGKIFAS